MEMLVVIGIIGILSSALINGVSHMKKVAKRTKALNGVTDARIALNQYLVNERKWTASMLSLTAEMDATVTKTLSNHKLLDAVVSGQTSLDRFGLLDDWGRDQLRRNPNVTAANQVGSDGVNIEEHLIQFRVDADYDGYVDDKDNSPLGLKIRGHVIVWSRGPDGKDDFENKNKRYPFDDIISWNHGQVMSEQGN